MFHQLIRARRNVLTATDSMIELTLIHLRQIIYLLHILQISAVRPILCLLHGRNLNHHRTSTRTWLNPSRRYWRRRHLLRVIPVQSESGRRLRRWLSLRVLSWSVGCHSLLSPYFCRSVQMNAHSHQSSLACFSGLDTSTRRKYQAFFLPQLRSASIKNQSSQVEPDPIYNLQSRFPQRFYENFMRTT